MGRRGRGGGDRRRRAIDRRLGGSGDRRGGLPALPRLRQRPRAPRQVHARRGDAAERVPDAAGGDRDHLGPQAQLHGRARSPTARRPWSTLGIVNGTTAMRAFADVDTIGGTRPVEGLLELKRRFEGETTFEVVAFPQEGIVREPGLRGADGGVHGPGRRRRRRPALVRAHRPAHVGAHRLLLRARQGGPARTSTCWSTTPTTRTRAASSTSRCAPSRRATAGGSPRATAARWAPTTTPTPRR